MNNITVDEIINEDIDKIVSIRHDIHEHPELGMHEIRTAKTVAENLKKLNLNIKTEVDKTGVVATLKGKNSGKTLLLRADMDALPLNETTNLTYKSINKGVMHACGHDVHTSVLIGTADILSKLSDNINGQVKFVFQPAEECSPTGGASEMIKEGILEDPHVDAAIALHVWPFPLGTVALRSGVMMAKSDRIFIKVKGKSSHGSAPHKGNDAIVTAGYFITALQTIISRNVDPLDNAVISIGKISGGDRYNIIADEVNMEGTVRTFNPDLSKSMPERIKKIIKNICAGLGCDYEFKYVNGYPETYNNKKLTEFVISTLEKSIGKENVIIANKPATGGEDFSYFTKKVPSTFMWLGCKSEINKDCCILHNPHFICDDNCIKVGIKSLCNIALNFLK